MGSLQFSLEHSLDGLIVILMLHVIDIPSMNSIKACQCFNIVKNTLFYKNIFYKNIEAEILRNVKNILRIKPRLRF